MSDGEGDDTDSGDDDAGTGDAEIGDAEIGDAEIGDAEIGDAGTGDRGTGDAGTGDAGTDGISDVAPESSESVPQEPCPECGEQLPAEARFCPHCASAIDEDGAAVALSELDGDLLPDDPAELLVEDEAGHRRASGSIRVLAGLAVSIPLAPLVLFLASSVVSLSVWSAGLVFLAGWLGPAALLSRARVPAEAFGHSLYLVAVCTLLVPLAVRSGGVSSGSDALALSFDVVALASFVIAGVAVALGTFVTRQARRRVSGENRAFEEAREE